MERPCNQRKEKAMKEYTVKYYVDNEKMIIGEIPHSEIFETEKVEADSQQEAIDLVFDYLCEQIIQNSEFSPERDGEKINILDQDGNMIQQYYGFSLI